jgi:hypothetical protein
LIEDSCRKAGIPCSTYLIEGAGHGVDLNKMQVDGRPLVVLIEQFLQIHLLHDKDAKVAAVSVFTKGPGAVTLNPPYGMYLKGTSVTITATPDKDADFLRWEGDATGTANPLTVTADKNKRITAVFGKR